MVAAPLTRALILTLALSLTGTIGCGRHSGDQDHDDDRHREAAKPAESKADPAHPIAPRAGSDALPEAFPLDDGKKWQMDEHTRASVGRLGGLLDGAGDDLGALADAFDAEIQVLIKGCTMTGPAHDQLHVFLMAFIPRVEGLRQGGEAAKATLAEIKTLFERYHVAFE